MTVRGNEAPAYCCARCRKRIDGGNVTGGYDREVNAVYILEGLVKDYAFLEIF